MEMLVLLIFVGVVIWIFKAVRSESTGNPRPKSKPQYKPKQKSSSCNDDMLFTGLVIGESLSSAQRDTQNNYSTNSEISSDVDLDAFEECDYFEEF